MPRYLLKLSLLILIIETCYSFRYVINGDDKLCNMTETGEHEVIEGLYYSFYQSRNTPSKDPVLLWLSGGPGCSSMVAMLFENGPCSVNEQDSIARPNPYSWTSVANVIWLDQPIGTGFSEGRTVKTWTEKSVIRKLRTFLISFFARHSDYQNNPFYIFGESYAGHYVPDLAYLILETGPANLKNVLKGIGIGNGLTDPAADYSSLPEMAYLNDPPLITEDEYEKLSDTANSCRDLIFRCQRANVDSEHPTSNCDELDSVCSNIEDTVQNGVRRLNLNPYDLRTQCYSDEFGLCYRFKYLAEFLNTEKAKNALNVHPRMEWAPCNMNVWGGHRVIDWYRETELKVKYLLEAGIRVIIYAGDTDSMCNWRGQENWTLNLDWNDKSGFNDAPVSQWVVNGIAAGQVRSSGGLTFVRVFNSGHMVPHDQPQAALDMLRTFVENGRF